MFKLLLNHAQSSADTDIPIPLFSDQLFFATAVSLGIELTVPLEAV
jgi:hypothetical protein